MPDPTFTGYVVVSIAVKDDDTPTRDPEEVAREILGAGIKDVVETRAVFSDGAGAFYPYGPGYAK